MLSGLFPVTAICTLAVGRVVQTEQVRHMSPYIQAKGLSLREVFERGKIHAQDCRLTVGRFVLTRPPARGCLMSSQPRSRSPENARIGPSRDHSPHSSGRSYSASCDTSTKLWTDRAASARFFPRGPHQNPGDRLGSGRSGFGCTSSEAFVPFAKSVPLKTKLMWMIPINPALRMQPFPARAYLLSVEVEASPDAVCRPPGVVDRALPSVSVQQGLLHADTQTKPADILAIDT